MGFLDSELVTIWRRTLRLGWPIAIEQTLETLMRTVDIIVTGLFSPVAVAAVGLADLYGQIPLRFGLGLGAGAIALSSQDTGRGAEQIRNRAITQALLLGGLCGLPIVILGLLFSHSLIAILGAESDVVRLGGLYLAIIFAAAPMRIILLVGARSLQGTGDTVTPMYINAGSNFLNITLTVGLGLGLWIAPTLGIVGVGLATAISRTVGAIAITGVIASGRRGIRLARPQDWTITKQLIAVSVPNFLEGMSSSLANFPFNALILLFGTEANAAYHIGRRIYQQLTGPIYRSLATVTSIIVGQTLGRGELDNARFAAKSILYFSIGIMSFIGFLIIIGAEFLVRIFTQDPATVNHAIDFTRAFGVSMVFIGIFFPLAGALRGAGDTRTPFYARLFGAFVVMLGGSYLFGVTFDFGLLGVYAGIILAYVAWVIIVTAGFLWGGWQELAVSMMSERADLE